MLADGVASTNPAGPGRGKFVDSGLPGDPASSFFTNPANLPLFSRLLQLPIPLGMDLLLTPSQ